MKVRNVWNNRNELMPLETLTRTRGKGTGRSRLAGSFALLWLMGCAVLCWGDSGGSGWQLQVGGKEWKDGKRFRFNGLVHRCTCAPSG